MLIIALPKTASTSLINTLKKLKYNAKTKTGLVHTHNIPNEFTNFSSMHSDMVEIDKILIDTFTNSQNFFYKQHIPPTKNNISLLKNKKVVLLLLSKEKNVDDIVLSYWRHMKKHNDIGEKKIIGDLNEQEWLIKTKKTNLYNEIYNFNKFWLDNSKNKLVIYKKDLIKDPTTNINMILNYFGKSKIEKNIVLEKSNMGF